MEEREKRTKWSPGPFLRILGSAIALAAIVLLGVNAVKFCLGLFLTGDYIVKFPGAESPVLYRAMEQEDATEPTEPDSGAVTEVSRATITIGGDIMMHMPIVRSGATDDGYNFDSVFTYITNYTSKSDYVAANLETTLAGTDNGNTYTGYPKFNSPDAIVDAVNNIGFDLLLTGNNHCNDYGTFGLKRTLDIIKNHGLDTLGTTSTATEPKYIVRDVDGIKIGMVCYTFASIGDDMDMPAVNDLPLDSNAAGLLNAFDYKKLDLFYSQMEEHVAGMKAEGAEAIILFIHWGDEYSTTANDYQKTIAQKMCDLGVDVIAGSHPHVIQTMDLLSSSIDPNHKTVCFYSMGNLLSNQRADNVSVPTGHTEDGVLFTFNYVKYSDGSVHMINAYVVPTWVLVRGGDGAKAYQILPLDTNLGDWKAVFELDDQQLTAAQNSYNRTTEILAEGRKAVQNYLNASREAREAEWAAAAGVTETTATV